MKSKKKVWKNHRNDGWMDGWIVFCDIQNRSRVYFDFIYSTNFDLIKLSIDDTNTAILRDFRIPPQSRRDTRSFGLLRSE
jgi:hypothetical protein